MDITFAKQIGLINFLFRGLVIKFLRKLKKDKFIYKTLFGKNYSIYNWDPSGAEVFLTQCFTDWGNEYFFLDSFKAHFLVKELLKLCQSLLNVAQLIVG